MAESDALAVGSKVRVRIANPIEYVMGVAEHLNGATGTVERRKHDYDYFLVRFTRPVKKWWGTGYVLSFWFESKDLQRLD